VWATIEHTVARVAVLPGPKNETTSIPGQKGHLYLHGKVGEMALREDADTVAVWAIEDTVIGTVSKETLIVLILGHELVGRGLSIEHFVCIRVGCHDMAIHVLEIDTGICHTHNSF
jgi:hypothetical protein